MPAWLAAPITLAAVWLGVHCHRHWLSLFPEDPPLQGRRRHREPTPMAGFLAASITGIGWLFADVPLLVTGSVLGATGVGYFDDRGKDQGEEMGWVRKAALLATVALGITLAAALQWQLAPLQWIAVWIWVFALINATNFMDNTDGVAASLGATGLLVASGGEGPMALAGFAFLGFLPANWPRPLVFLGDSGALGLGAILAWLSLREGAVIPAAADWRGVLWPLGLAAILPVVLLIADFIQVILARLYLGVPPWEGDRRHLTHIIHNLGVPRMAIAPTLAATTLGLYWWSG